MPLAVDFNSFNTFHKTFGVLTLIQYLGSKYVRQLICTFIHFVGNFDFVGDLEVHVCLVALKGNAVRVSIYLHMFECGFILSDLNYEHAITSIKRSLQRCYLTGGTLCLLAHAASFRPHECIFSNSFSKCMWSLVQHRDPMMTTVMLPSLCPDDYRGLSQLSSLT